MDDHDYGLMFRAKVLGGWLVRADLTEMDFDRGEARAKAISMTFVPDPGHEWEV